MIWMIWTLTPWPLIPVRRHWSEEAVKEGRNVVNKVLLWSYDNSFHQWCVLYFFTDSTLTLYDVFSESKSVNIKQKAFGCLYGIQYWSFLSNRCRVTFPSDHASSLETIVSEEKLIRIIQMLWTLTSWWLIPISRHWSEGALR